jgi:hypothetical protein
MGSEPLGKGPFLGIEPGSTVITADGQELGTVKDVTETSFKVDVEMARDYWLNRDTIVASDSHFVKVNFNSTALDDHKLSEPAILSSETVERSKLEETVSEGESEAAWDRTQRHLGHQGGRIRGSEHYERPPRPTRGAGGSNP